MSRFGNLEFGDEAEGRFSPEPARSSGESQHLEAAQAAFAQGEFERALRRYAKVLEFNPQNTSAWAGQVRMLIELGEFTEAKLWADKALEKFPHEPELLAAKGVALARLGDLDAALLFSDAALAERGDAPYLWLARGDVLLARQEARADYCFEKAQALAPQNWFVNWLAARVRLVYDQFVLALKLLEQALEWDAGRFVLWLELGRTQAALGLPRPARQSLLQARQLNPQSRALDDAWRALEDAGAGARLQGWWRRLFKP
jgi:tetratricopeptide (TPR) repeat protein